MVLVYEEIVDAEDELVWSMEYEDEEVVEALLERFPG